MMGIGRIDGSSESTPGPRHGAKIVPGAHVPVRLATDKPVMAVPAMNVRMWEHAATRKNVETLRDFRKHCDLLISVGDCATMGGVPASKRCGGSL